MTTFFVACMKHTRRTDPYITFWRKEDAGYCWPLSWAAEHSEEHIRSKLGYYHDGDDNIAVDADAVKAIARAPRPRTVDGDAGPVVLNNAANWHALLDAMIEQPKSTPQPQYRGARRAA